MSDLKKRVAINGWNLLAAIVDFAASGVMVAVAVESSHPGPFLGFAVFTFGTGILNVVLCRGKEANRATEDHA